MMVVGYATSPEFPIAVQSVWKDTTFFGNSSEILSVRFLWIRNRPPGKHKDWQVVIGTSASLRNLLFKLQEVVTNYGRMFCSVEIGSLDLDGIGLAGKKADWWCLPINRMTDFCHVWGMFKRRKTRRVWGNWSGGGTHELWASDLGPRTEDATNQIHWPSTTLNVTAAGNSGR